MLISGKYWTLIDKSGLSLVDSIETLQEKEHRPLTKKTLTEVKKSLYEGLPFSVALENAHGAFPPLYVALVCKSACYSFHK